LALAGCGGGDKKPEAAKPAETYTIKIANFYAADHPINQSVKKFQEIVEAKTGGKVKIQNFPNSALGSEDVFIDSVKKGTVQMGIPGTMLSRDVPAYAIVEMPFLFTGWDHARKVLNGPITEEMNKPLIEKTGMRLMGVAVNGMRVISSSKPVNKYEDLKGLRLRVPNVPYYVEMVKAFGGVPTALPLSEVFNALEQKVVDGQDNPYPTVRASKFYEVQKFIVESNHMFSPANWVINEKFFQSLPKEYQTIVADAAKEAIQHNWDISIKKDQDDKKFLQANGITIVVPDKDFRDKILDSQKNVYTWFYEKYPGTKELADKIRATK
jgi:tripartite ATP-independent transporter DctP family solute receptor